MLVVAAYGAFLSHRMGSAADSARWRIISWGVFAGVFFTQLALGLLASDIFLMTGKLHLPIPAMVLAGPLYRGETSVMTILFLSTLLLSGPAWCSHLCYFGALDAWASSRSKPLSTGTKWKWAVKFSILFFVVAATLILRWFQVPILLATSLAVAFGIVGIGIMIFVSGRKGSMIHCVLYCPIGTLVNLLRYVNPFRMAIAPSCNSCMKCNMVCRYDALKPEDIKSGVPGITCSLCGDCLGSCRQNSIHYKFLGLSPVAARNLYLIITVTLHTVFLAVARM